MVFHKKTAKAQKNPKAEAKVIEKTVNVDAMIEKAPANYTNSTREYLRRLVQGR